VCEDITAAAVVWSVDLGIGFFALIFQVSLKFLGRFVDANGAIDDVWQLVPGSFGYRGHKISRLPRSLFESLECLLANAAISERFHIVIIIYGSKSRPEGNHDWPKQVSPPTNRVSRRRPLLEGP
jgi:hypothetical protein